MIDGIRGRRAALLVEQGSGAQVVEPLLAAVDAAGGRVDWVPEAVDAGPLAPAAVRAARAVRLGLCTGPLDQRPAPDAALAGVRFRIPAGDAHAAHTLLVMHELSEGVGTGIELAAGSPAARELVALLAVGDAAPGTAVTDTGQAALAVGTRSAEVTGRVFALARDYARATGVPRLTVVHKGNAVKCTDGILVRVATGAAPGAGPQGDGAPAVELRIVDALCAELLLHPRRHRALLVPRLYADLVRSLAAALAGRPLRATGHLVLADGLVLAGHRGPRGRVEDPESRLTRCLAAAVQLLRHLGQDGAADRLDERLADRPEPT